MGSIRGKNWRSKISCYCPFKRNMPQATLLRDIGKYLTLALAFLIFKLTETLVGELASF
jgi:hypothetical protein